MSISLEEVRRVAALAHLELSDAEAVTMQRELSKILAYIDQLNEVELPADTGDERPISLELRDDVPAESLPSDQVAANAPSFARGHFVVPRVLGGEE